MSSDRNRLHNFWDRSETNLKATIDNFTNDGSKTNNYFKDNYQTEGKMYKKPMEDFSFNKNEWIQDKQEYCSADVGIRDVDSTCYYYDIFDHPAVPYMDF